MTAHLRSLSTTVATRGGHPAASTAIAVLGWVGAWFAARVIGGDGLAAASAFAVPVAFVARRFGWHAGALVALASAIAAGPLSPAAGADVSDGQTLTLAAAFVAVASAAALDLRRDREVQPPPAADVSGFAGIALELRTPLQALQGAIGVLEARAGQADRNSAAALETVRRATARLADLEDLLAAVSCELATERRADDQTLVELRHLVGDLAVELRSQGGLDRVRFDGAHDADVLMSHPDRVSLLLRCLVGDALRVTPSDQPVDVTVRRDVDTLVMRVCAASVGAGTVGSNLRMVAAQELAQLLGGSLDAIDAGGAVQVTVRLPQRRDTDPADTHAQPARPDAVTLADVSSSLGSDLTLEPAEPDSWSRTSG